jgi:hemerythrin
MTDLQWHEFFEIGVNFIDEDHKKLLTIMQNIQKAVNESDTNKCIVLFTALLKEAREHFAREENYLAKVNYPELEAHKEYHQQLLNKADITKRICEGVETKHDLQECFDGMAEFLIDDILRGDIKFKSYLEFNGYIKK